MNRTSPPAVLMIVADDWSPIAGCYGNQVIHTPHIELHNLITDPALHDTVAQMRHRLTQLRIRTRDPWLEVDFQEGQSFEA